MRKTTNSPSGLCLVFCALLLQITSILAQNQPYQAIRLNNGNPIIEPSMFSNSTDGRNINGPSLIRVPDWIPSNRRAHQSAQYYLYFGDHAGDYIRMAWAAQIEGPYTLYNDFSNRGDRGVLDNGGEDIFLDNRVRIEENHLSSPDVHVDNENRRIIMYFHSGSSFFVDGDERSSQVTWATTSPYGLEFYDNIESAHLGVSYFKVFEANGDLYSLDNGSNINRALNSDDPWSAPTNHDFRDRLWQRNPSGHVFQDDIPVPSSELRVRHTGVHVDGDQLLAFYSRRGEFQERILLSTIDINRDWSQWDPTYPPIEILTGNPGWEGGQLRIANSETSSATDVNQLRDPDIFQDNDGQLYLLYSGNGEGGIGIARLYKTPDPDITLTATADAHVREGSGNNFGLLNTIRTSTGSNSSDQRRIYMKFDLSQVSNIEHASIRLFANETSGGPITVYETSSNWDEDTINSNNAPSLGDPISTVHLTEDSQYYEWNISDYADQNTSSELSVVFDIAPSNDASHEFRSIQTGNSAELLISTSTTTPPAQNGGIVHMVKRSAKGFAIDGNRGGANRQNVYIWDSNSGNVNQQWNEIDRGNGYYSYQKANTNFCIDGNGGGANGQNVYLYECRNNNQNQHWRKVNMGDGNFRLEKRNAPGFSLDGGNGGANGQNLYLWQSNDLNQNQHWAFSTVNKSNNLVLENNFKAFPIPFSDVLNIQLDASELETRVDIISITGQMVASKVITGGTGTMDVSNLRNGMYIAKATNSSNTYSIKLIKDN